MQTDFQFISVSTLENIAYQGQISFERFCKLADSQFSDSDIPEYGATGSQYSLRYGATTGSIKIEYSERFQPKQWWMDADSNYHYWSINDHDHYGGGETLEDAVEEYHRSILNEKLKRIQSANHIADYIEFGEDEF